MNEYENSKPLEAGSPYELRKDQGVNISDSELKHFLRTGEVGLLHSFTTGSAVDGPGIRIVAWTSGCQFRCQYCHNPDTWKMTNGTPVTLSKAIEEINKYSSGLKLMSGGFTLSGGEPLVQDRFAVKLFNEVKKLGIHTALDTNGSLGNRLSDEEINLIDLILLDIKSWDPARHKKVTGNEIEPVLKFAARLSGLKRPVWLRYVLVPSLTDNREDILKIAEFASQLGNIERVDVLPFHQMGKYKWNELGMKYKLKDVESPSPQRIATAVEYFRSAGLKAY